MKKMFLAASVALALPMGAQAQSLQYPGFYIGAEGGLNWLLNNNSTTTLTLGGVGTASTTNGFNSAMGWAAGGMIGYDFVGPRVELEGLYRDNKATIGPVGADFNQISVMGNVYYDFMAGSAIVPYVGAGAGVAFQNLAALNTTTSTTQFAYQAMLGVGYNVNSLVRLNLEGRYFGTTNPNFAQSAGPVAINTTFPNNNISVMASIQFKFGAPTEAAPPPPPAAASAPSFMVFFDWDRSNLSAQALNTIKQAAGAYKSKGSARITATGHTDTSGPADYNMALSLRRANAVKDALVREGVPATAISVIGKGEEGLLVPTADGVREPQNRRVEIVIQ